MMSKPPVYQANATVMVELNPERVLTSMQGLVDNRRIHPRMAVDNHLERIQSRKFAALVADELNPSQIDQLVQPFIHPDYPDRKPNPLGILERVHLGDRA